MEDLDRSRRADAFLMFFCDAFSRDWATEIPWTEDRLALRDEADEELLEEARLEEFEDEALPPDWTDAVGRGAAP